MKLLACGAALTCASCSRPAQRQSPPSASAKPAAASSHSVQQVAPRAGRTLALDLSGDTVEQAWQSVATALAESAARIDALELDGSAAPFGDEGLQRLLEHQPQLAPVRLRLAHTKITPEGLKALLASSVLGRLQVLDLTDNYLGAPGARLLAETTRLGSLKELNLARNHLHARGAAALAAARALPELARLELEYNFIGPEGAEALATSQALPNLRDLGLAYNFLGDDGARHVASANWPALELLDVGSNEIGAPGAKALAASTTLSPRAFIGFGLNLTDSRLAQLGLQKRLRVEAFPERAERATLGDADAFDLPRHPASLTLTSAPEDLPASVDFRELRIWEFGLVAEFPTFLLPERRPGNGKSRSFSWLDRASLSIGGYWILPGQTFSEELSSFSRAEPGGRVRVERRNAQTAIVRQSDAAKKRVARVQSRHGALLYIDFTYPADEDAYFAPIAERVVNSLYFERAKPEK